MIVDEEIDFNLIKHPQVKDLLQKMLRKNQEERLTLDQILKHDWVTEEGTKQVDIK